jgi:hypothetical protein
MSDIVGMTVHKFYPINTSLRALSRELAMTDSAVPSLQRKREKMVREINAHKAELRVMLRDLNALDCAIRLFDPETESAKR